MYMVIRSYRLAEGSLKEAVDRTKEGFLATIGSIPGFIDYYYLHSDGSVVTINVFEDRASAEQSTRIASEWVKKNIPDLYAGPPTVISGDVMIHRHGEGRQDLAA